MREREELACPNCGVKTYEGSNTSYLTLLGTDENTLGGARTSEQGGSDETENAMRSIESIDDAIRARLQERVRERLTGVAGFLGPLPRPIGSSMMK